MQKVPIIRGITFGNNQGQSVQSSMDMQIAGKLEQRCFDSRVVFQTIIYRFKRMVIRRLCRNLIKIYLQLKIKDKSILKRDISISQDDQTYFGKYQRRSTGNWFSDQFWENNKTFLDFSAGVARSEFHRIRFQGVEGNQGAVSFKWKKRREFHHDFERF